MLKITNFAKSSKNIKSFQEHTNASKCNTAKEVSRCSSHVHGVYGKFGVQKFASNGQQTKFCGRRRCHSRNPTAAVSAAPRPPPRRQRGSQKHRNAPCNKTIEQKKIGKQNFEDLWVEKT